MKRRSSRRRVGRPIIPEIVWLTRGRRAGPGPSALLVQRPELRRRPREPQLRPARGHRLVDRAAEFRAPGELLDVTVLHARVDERLGAVGALLGRVLRRIEPGRPRLAEDVDVLHRVTTGGYRP